MALRGRGGVAPGWGRLWNGRWGKKTNFDHYRSQGRLGFAMAIIHTRITVGWSRDWHTFPIKCQVENISGFAGCSYGCNCSLAIVCRSCQRQQVNKRVWLCSNKTVFTKTGSRLDLAWRLQFADDPWVKELWGPWNVLLRFLPGSLPHGAQRTDSPRCHPSESSLVFVFRPCFCRDARRQWLRVAGALVLAHPCGTLLPFKGQF